MIVIIIPYTIIGLRGISPFLHLNNGSFKALNMQELDEEESTTTMQSLCQIMLRSTVVFLNITTILSQDMVRTTFKRHYMQEHSVQRPQRPKRFARDFKCHYFLALPTGSGSGPAAAEHPHRCRQWDGASRNQGN